MNNTEKINMLDAVLLAARAVLVIALAFAMIYGLNAVMTAFIAEEDAAAEIVWQRERELRRLQEDYDIASAFWNITSHYDGQFLEIFEKHVNAEYILLGTSHITHGVTPEVLEQSGRRFFNFALNGATPSYYIWWYNDVFKPSRYITPRAIIFGVNWFMFDSGWLWRRPSHDFQYLRANRDPPGYEPSDYDAPVVAMRYTGAWYDIDELVTFISNRFPVFSSRDRFIDLILPQETEEAEIIEFEGIPVRQERERVVTHEGFVLSSFYKGFVPWHAEFHGHYAGTARTNFHQAEYDAFRTLLQQFADDGIPVVFVMTPEFLPGRTAPQFDEMTEIINRIAREKNIPFLNYNTTLVSEINSDYTLYSDWGHLNYTGARIFSQILHDDLNMILGFDR